MAQQTMSEKDMYLGTMEHEDQISLKVLKVFPPDQMNFKAHPTSQTAGQIAWTMALGHMVLERIITGEVTPSGLPAPPTTWQAILEAFERSRRDAATKIAALKDEDLNQMVRMPTGPGTMGEVRRGSALWMFLHDGIHHRGQLSVYLRMVGGRVPSIYGPSKDEPWS